MEERNHSKDSGWGTPFWTYSLQFEMRPGQELQDFFNRVPEVTQKDFRAETEDQQNNGRRNIGSQRFSWTVSIRGYYIWNHLIDHGGLKQKGNYTQVPDLGLLMHIVWHDQHGEERIFFLTKYQINLEVENKINEKQSDKHVWMNQKLSIFIVFFLLFLGRVMYSDKMTRFTHHSTGVVPEY